MHISTDILVTFVAAAFFGMVLIVVAQRLKVPSIVLLLLGGVLLGESSPLYPLIRPAVLGDGLRVVVQLAVAVILFEGGLTLDVRGYRGVSSEIRRALTLGMLVTWSLTALALKLLFSFSWPLALLAASLVIVTGPTVIGPLLKRLKVRRNVHHYLHWESVFVDPIGVFIALLCYEWVVGGNALALFTLRIVTGVVTGVAVGGLLSLLVRRGWIDEERRNSFVLASALGSFVVSELIVPESGLMTVIVAGLVLGLSPSRQLESVRQYKAQLTELFIGLVFMLLAAGLNVQVFMRYNLGKLAIALVAVIFIIRPLNVLVATWGRTFSWREKIFLGWIAPRGIVAASMASLFALNLRELRFGDYALNHDFLEAFTYGVIIVTVVLQGFSARFLGKALDVLEPVPTGWLIIGAHTLGRAVARFIGERGYHAILVDSNLYNVRVARREGLPVIAGDALAINPDDHPDLSCVGAVLAITRNVDLNQLACQTWGRRLDAPALYQWRYDRTGTAATANDADTGCQAAGSVIWPTLPLDRLSVMTLEERDFVTFSRDITTDRIRHPERVLMFADREKLLPFLPPDAAGTATCLAYRPLVVKLDINMRPHWILFQEAESMHAVLAALLDTLREDYPDLNRELVERSLIAQEREYSSAIGYHAALPHAYVDGLHESIVLMAKLVQPLVSTHSGEKIIFVFLVLSSWNHPDLHIETLSKISKFLLDEHNRKDLQEAFSREALIDVFFPEGASY